MKVEVTFNLSFSRMEWELFLHIYKSIPRYAKDRIAPDIKVVVVYWIQYLLNTHLMITEAI